MERPPALALALLLAALAPCAQAAGVAVSDAWVRATPPGVRVAALYLTLRNDGDRPEVLVGLESPLAGHAMVHETRIEQGRSRMRPVAQLRIAPRGTVRLAPGGLHVMLHDLKDDLPVGRRIPLMLRFASGETVRAAAVVRPLGSP